MPGQPSYTPLPHGNKMIWILIVIYVAALLLADRVAPFDITDDWYRANHGRTKEEDRRHFMATYGADPFID